MAQKPFSSNPSCPHCGAARVVRNGHRAGQQRWLCRECGRTFGAISGAAPYRLRTPPAEIARALRIVRRYGSLKAAEEVTGHKYETVGRWLRAASRYREAITGALVNDLHLTNDEVERFWMFVDQSRRMLEAGQARRRGWAHTGVINTMGVGSFYGRRRMRKTRPL